MKKSRFTEAQIVAILKELDAGATASELGRRHGIHANTIRLALNAMWPRVRLTRATVRSNAGAPH